jgi:hypothetical protein
MNLWILRPAENLPDDDNPWKPWYDKAFAFVVRAENEDEARRLADCNGGSEREGHAGKAWFSNRYSECLELPTGGEPGVVIRDFASA